MILSTGELNGLSVIINGIWLFFSICGRCGSWL